MASHYEKAQAKPFSWGQHLKRVTAQRDLKTTGEILSGCTLPPYPEVNRAQMVCTSWRPNPKIQNTWSLSSAQWL